MKILFTMILVIGLAVNCFALTATETKKLNATEITISFTQDEYDLFTMDKADAKEWVRNAMDVNCKRINKGIAPAIVVTEQGKNLVISIPDSDIQMDWKGFVQGIIGVNTVTQEARIKEELKNNLYRNPTETEYRAKVRKLKQDRIDVRI